MPLPILSHRQPPSRADLLRLFMKAEARWCEQLSEPVATDFGTAYANAQYPMTWSANQVLDAELPDHLDAQTALLTADGFFESRETHCYRWIMNVSAAAGRVAPLVDALKARGFREDPFEVHALERTPEGRVVEAGGLKIIPARASFKHVRQILEESWSSVAYGPQHVDALMNQLDDPHWDALLILKDARPVAYGGVLSVGEFGRIDDVYVSPAFRRQGIGTTLMSRLVEICARSLFKTVLLATDAANAPAHRLYAKFGFRRVGEIVNYLSPRAVK